MSLNRKYNLSQGISVGWIRIRSFFIFSLPLSPCLSFPSFHFSISWFYICIPSFGLRFFQTNFALLAPPVSLKERVFHSLLGTDPLWWRESEHLQEKVNKVLAVLHHVKHFIQILPRIPLELPKNAGLKGHLAFILLSLGGSERAQDLENFKKLITFSLPLEQRCQ